MFGETGLVRCDAKGDDWEMSWDASGIRSNGSLGELMIIGNQWPFQEPKLEVPTIYKAYVRECPHKI